MYYYIDIVASVQVFPFCPVLGAPPSYPMGMSATAYTGTYYVIDFSPVGVDLQSLTWSETEPQSRAGPRDGIRILADRCHQCSVPSLHR